MKHLLSLAALLALSACGGGGGDSATSPGTAPGTSPSTPSSNTGLSIRFDKSSLNFEFNEGDAPATQVITATASGDTEKDVLMGAEVNGKGIQTPIQIAVDRSARTGMISVVPERALAAGTYSGSIRMLACANQDCSVQHGGSPHTVSYTITVRPGLKPSATSLNLAAAETGPSSVSTISFTPPAAGATVTAAVNYLNGQSGWLDARIAGNTLQVQASARALGAGSYRADVLLTAPLSGQAVTIPVQLTVGNGLTVPESASVTVDSAATAAQLQGTVALALAPGATATTWKATSNQAWLELPRASGGFDAPPTWSVNIAAFGALANNTHHVAEITIGTDSNLPARTFKLDVHKALAEIRGLDAVALLAGQSGDVLVYGSGFTSLPAGTNGVSVGGVQPTAATVLTDNVLRITLPVVQAGTYPVALRSASGVTTAGKNIVVTGTGAYTYQALDTAGIKNTVIWDAVSRSAFVVNAKLKSVMRYADVNGRFQLVTTRSFPAVDTIAMSPDRTALVLQAGFNVIHKLDPANLATIATFDLGAYGGSPDSSSMPLTIMGDNRLMHSLWGWVDLETGAYSQVQYEKYGYSFNPASFGIVSGDGMRMIVPDSGLVTPRGPMFHTDLLAGGKLATYSTTMSPYFYRGTVNHDGSVWSLEGTVVDFDLNVRGYAKLPDGWLSNQAVLSRDGTRLYHYAQSATAGTKPRVYVFDTSKAMTTEVNLPVLGHIEFAHLPNCPYDSNNYDYENCATFRTHITISDDGKALFIAGDRKFVVLPIPAAMASKGATQAARASAGQVLMQGARR